jgi:hypothetical protein
MLSEISSRLLTEWIVFLGLEQEDEKKAEQAAKIKGGFKR